MNNDWKERQLYWASLQYARLWMLHDGVWCKEVACSGLTEKPLREIAINYNVNRGIVAALKAKESPTGRKHDRAAIDLCTLLNNEARNWPNSLIDRAKACERIVQAAIKSNCFKKFQGSAVTKFMWFLKPDGWTMFDSYAAKGLGSSSNVGQGQKMHDFYRKLHCLGFEELSKNMQKVIDDSPTKGLPATRILDTLMMARGGRDGDERSIRRTQFFLDLLPPAAACDLRNIAETLQRRFGNDVLKKQ